MGTAEALALETLQHRKEQDKDHRWLVLNICINPSRRGPTYHTWCVSALGTGWLKTTPGLVVRVREAPSSCHCSAGQG